MDAGYGISRGALAAEADLVAAVLAHFDFDPQRGLPAAPVRVIVPSRSLREHIASRLAGHRAALLGLCVQTLSATVAEILATARDRGLDTRRTCPTLFGVVVRQLAAREPTLRGELHGLDRGYRAVEADVSDLLDAGFAPAHADAVIEHLHELAADSGADWERACQRATALVRIAAAASDARDRFGIAHDSADFVRAREWLEADSAFLPARAIFVYGFADATGVQIDLIETLVRRRGARVSIDWPSDPAEPERIDGGVGFTARLMSRLPRAPDDVAPGVVPPAARPAVLHAPSREAEVRAVAGRVRALIDAGVNPERIGVVARGFDGYRGAIRTHFGRLSIPFSGIAETAGATAAGRRQLALIELLRDAERTPIERWLDASLRLGRSGRLALRERADLASAYHGLGIGRVAQAAAWEGDGVGWLELAGRRGLRAGSGERAAIPVRRGVSGTRMRSASDAARGSLRRLARWPRRAALREHLRALQVWVRRDLRWRPGDPEFDAFERALTPLLVPEAAVDLPIDREDFVDLVEGCVAGAVGAPIGGAGAGVAVLSVMESRARTFDHLFAIGLSRDVFPRAVSEDPLLPDSLRRRMRVVLPDLPVKREALDEERYLFAQLVSSSPRVVLSCPVADESGRPIPVSPLLERIADVAPLPAPGLWTPSDASLRPAHEHALVAGLHGTPDQFRRALRIAANETGGAERDRAWALADARFAVLMEWRDPGSGRQPPGPYFGFVGPVIGKADPRRTPLFATIAERIANCPWQAFVERMLRVEAPPDSRAELPAADARLVGAGVHDVLEQVVHRSGVAPDADLETLARQPGAAVRWPEPAEERTLVDAAAEALAVANGIRVPGFAQVLAARVREYLTVAKSLWPGGEVRVLGAETAGVARIGAGARELRFLADRVERGADGELRLIDYKTGATIAPQKTAGARYNALLKRVSAGKSLQAGAYALAAAQASGEPASGCYQFLAPELPDYARHVELRSDERDWVDRFQRTVSAVVDVVDTGSFFPRLVDASTGSEPFLCSRCAVRESCIRGDSGARRRLENWATKGQPVSAQERALLALWQLGEDDA